jgi:hypothetical protein
MKIVYISILMCSIWTVCFAIRPQVQSAPDGPTIIRGRTEAVEGSPVVLFDARYELVRPASTPGETKVLGRVKIENVSGRPIRVLMLRFAYKLRFSMNVVANLGALRTGESRDYKVENMNLAENMVSSPGANGMTLTVMATGAEFEGGSHWAAPRTQSRPLGSLCLNKAGAYLTPRSWQIDRAPYNALFEVLDPGIVAYRLGTVTDTPSSFAVTLGEWADLAEPERRRGGQIAEPGRSLKANQILGESEASGTMTHPAEAGIFVAELRLADGRVWRQDTSREELLWNY